MGFPLTRWDSNRPLRRPRLTGGWAGTHSGLTPPAFQREAAPQGPRNPASRHLQVANLLLSLGFMPSLLRVHLFLFFFFFKLREESEPWVSEF